MSQGIFSEDGQAIPLLAGRRPIVLGADGMDHPLHLRGRRRAFTPYSTITHLATSSHAAWIGTRKTVYILARGMFAQTGGPEVLVHALYRHIAQQPGGAAQLARMAEIEQNARSARPLRATWTLAGICLAVFALQLLVGSDIEAVGGFAPRYFWAGDLWRVVTANFVHAAPRVPVHLGLNLLALIVLGALVERPLGAARTAVIMGVSGVGAMLASGVVEGLPVVGASGIVFGLVGSALWLEYRWAERLPAWWRYPRRSLIFLVVLNAVLGFVIPFISGAAHLGGLVAGAAATALVTPEPARFGVAPRWVGGLAAAMIALAVFATGSAAWELTRPGDYIARQAARLAVLPDVTALELNDTAWTLATRENPSREMLEAALELAERATAETERADPNVLDTLAEVQFQLGRRDAAVATIDEAIAHAPEEPYFREQRKRFTGERDPDDRPDAPLPSWMREPVAPDPPLRSPEPGLTV